LTVPIDYAAAGDLLEAYGRALATFDGDAWVDLFDEDATFQPDPFAPALAGHNDLRRYLLDASRQQEQVAFTVERHWVAGETALAVWHLGFVDRHTQARIRRSGFITATVGDDGRISQARTWWMEAPKGAEVPGGGSVGR
jgi:ketosteroid isomerase-like protein